MITRLRLLAIVFLLGGILPSLIAQTFTEQKKTYPVSADGSKYVVNGFIPFSPMSDENIYANALLWTIKNVCSVQREGITEVSVPAKSFSCNLVLTSQADAKQKNTYYCTAVSMGNPHVIQYVDTLDFDIEAIGPKFEHASLFPESVNTEFVKVVDRQHLKMRVWERGSGETMACGTGACAVMYASYLNNKCDEKVDVELLGGHLQIELRDKKIFMTGPARTTFEGTLKEKEYA